MRHIRDVHEKNKSHMCKLCDAAFLQNYMLRRHFERVLEGKKPHKCDKCNAAYFENLKG